MLSIIILLITVVPLSQGAVPISKNFLHKCSPEIVESHLQIPALFRANNASGELHNYTLPLVEKAPRCANVFEVSISKILVDVTRVLFTKEGHLVYFVEQDEGTFGTLQVYFHRDNFCISRLTEDSVSLKLCKSKCLPSDAQRGGHPCLRKCCSLGKGLDSSSSTNITEVGVRCSDLPDDREWFPEFTLGEGAQDFGEVRPQFYYQPSSEQSESLDQWVCSAPLQDVQQTQCNSLSLEQHYIRKSHDQFCLDNNANKSPTINPSDLKAPPLWQCTNLTYDSLEVPKREKLEFRKVFTFVTFLPCSVFHLLIILAYASIWSKQNVHGWAVMGYAVSKFISNMVVLTVLGSSVFQGCDSNTYVFGTGLCAMLGILHHFFAISTHTWTTIITFDTWTKISSMRPTALTPKDKRRFISYMVFALGVPAVVVAVACAMEFTFRLYRDGKLLPGYMSKCIINGAVPYLVYIGIPNILLYVTNLVLAFLTFKSLWEAKKSVQLLKGGSKVKFENRATLIGRLIIMTGFFLIIELLLDVLKGVSEYFFILEVNRLFHGLVSFWIFVCNVKTLKQLKDKYPNLWVWKVSYRSREDGNLGREPTLMSDTRETSAL